MTTFAKLLAFSLTAIALAGAAQAQDLPSKATETKTVYEGVDAQGQIVRVTVTSVAGATPVVVSAHATKYPQLHWTAHIGSGSAATLER